MPQSFCCDSAYFSAPLYFRMLWCYRNCIIIIIVWECIEPSLGYISVTDSMCLSPFRFSWWVPKDACVVQYSSLSPYLTWLKVVDFSISRKHVCSSCSILLGNCRNVVPVSHRFTDIAEILLTTATSPLFWPKFGVAPIRVGHQCLGSCNYFLSEQTYIATVHQCCRWTDRAENLGVSWNGARWDLE